MGFMLCKTGSLLPFTGMTVAMLAQVSTMVITKKALSQGINKYVILVYANSLTAILLLPCSFIAHRSHQTPVTVSLLRSFFLLSFVGFCAQISGYVGLQYGSPTLATAMLNLIPAFTFLLAITFRFEKLDCRSKVGIAKSLGTIVSIAGAFIVTFYNGPALHGIQSHIIEPNQQQFFWVIGAFFLAFEALMDSAWYIWQALILKRFPAVIILVCYLFVFDTILCGIFAWFLVKDASSWIVKPDIGLIAILYTGVVGLAFRIGLIAWCLRKAGPLYVAMFKPLAIVFSIITDVIFLGDALSLGSLIGGFVIIIGFYSVIWGKTQEEEMSEGSVVGNSQSSGENVPLLRNKVEEVL